MVCVCCGGEFGLMESMPVTVMVVGGGVRVPPAPGMDLEAGRDIWGLSVCYSGLDSTRTSW